MKLMLLTLMAIVMTNSFALEVYKGKIISNKEWATDNIRAVFNDAQNTVPRLKFYSNITHKAFSTVSLAEGMVGRPVIVTSSHVAFIHNKTKLTKTFHYTMSICGIMPDRIERCSYYFDKVELEAGGYFYNEKQPLLQLVFNKTGEYPTFSSTAIYDESDKNIDNYSSSTSDGKILISENTLPHFPDD